MKKATLIVIFSVLLSVSAGCLLKEKPEMKQSPALQPTPGPTSQPNQPTGRVPLDIKIIADNLTPLTYEVSLANFTVLNLTNSTVLNLTILGKAVQGGTSVRLFYNTVGLYPDGASIINPLEINISFKPQEVFFPRTVNKTEPPYNLYSDLTIMTDSPPSDVDYLIEIGTDKGFGSVLPIFFKKGKGGNLSKLFSKECTPLLFGYTDPFPVPGSRGVPVTTNISIKFSRLPPIVELKIKPEVEIGNITKEIFIPANARVTFHPAKPLQSGTAYTVTITYGSKEPPKDHVNFCLTENVSWQFATAYDNYDVGNTATATP